MPWTKTTGMRPGRYGVAETRGGRSFSDPGEPAQEPESLELHGRNAGEREGQGRRRIVLEGDLFTADRDRLRVPGQKELELARQRLLLHQGAPGRRDPKEGGDGHLEPRRHQVATGL